MNQSSMNELTHPGYSERKVNKVAYKKYAAKKGPKQEKPRKKSRKASQNMPMHKKKMNKMMGY